MLQKDQNCNNKNFERAVVKTLKIADGQFSNLAISFSQSYVTFFMF
jgi:hypothetical protein